MTATGRGTRGADERMLFRPITPIRFCMRECFRRLLLFERDKHTGWENMFVNFFEHGKGNMEAGHGKQNTGGGNAGMLFCQITPIGREDAQVFLRELCVYSWQMINVTESKLSCLKIRFYLCQTGFAQVLSSVQTSLHHSRLFCCQGINSYKGITLVQGMYFALTTS